MAAANGTTQQDQIKELSSAEETLRQAQAKADAPGATQADADAVNKARAVIDDLVNATVTPAIVPQAYAPGEGFGVGDRAPENRYGVQDPQGVVTPTAGGGKAEPKGGEYGVIVVVKGDTVTADHRRILGL